MRRTDRLLAVCALALVTAAGRLHAEQPRTSPGTVEPRLVAAYESLADTIVALEIAETKLMHALLAQYHDSAQQHLSEALAAVAAGQDAAPHLEKAAEEIGKLAIEGGRDVEAIKLRLQKAGHHHNTAEGESYEYLLVGPELRKSLLDLSKQAGQLGSAAKEGLAEKIRKLAQEIESEFKKLP